MSKWGCGCADCATAPPSCSERWNGWTWRACHGFLHRAARPPHRGFRPRRNGVLMRIHWFFVGMAFLVAGCARGTEPKPITLATTTSTQDSGLLDALLPQFRAATGIEVKV